VAVDVEGAEAEEEEEDTIDLWRFIPLTGSMSVARMTSFAMTARSVAKSSD
jgi:hypothetical protein